MSAPHIRPSALGFGIRTCRTRLPFRFGIATMTEAPLLTVCVDAETEGGTVRGHASDLLVPKWFAKNPATSHEDDRRDLIDSARRAFDVMSGSAGTVFDLWLNAQRALVESVPREHKLVATFGVSIVERALIDAVCRATGRPFDAALREDAFGLRFGEIDPALDGWTAERLAPANERIRVRHTVGLVDALEAADVPEGDERGDGHPACLTDDIAAYGLSAFKIKVSGDAASDRERLERIAALVPDGATITLDGNEQFDDPNALADLLDEIDSSGGCEGLLDGLRVIEQPVHRARTFDPETASGVARLAERAPVIIDEADAGLDAYALASKLGYGGVSMKACKGAIRAILSRARFDVDSNGGVQSGEDLTNLPALPLHQDLALASSLGLDDVERNGHHYFQGTSHLDDAEREHLMREHATLYRENGTLRIDAGALDVSSVVRTNDGAFGYAGPISLDVTPDAAPLLDERQGTAR